MTETITTKQKKIIHVSLLSAAQFQGHLACSMGKTGNSN
jgi:hypothetical protein